MSITLLFFGMATDLVGTTSSIIPFNEEMCLQDFKTLLFSKYSELKKLNQFAVAINEEYALEDSIVKPGDTIAIIPPVSGG